MRWVSNKIDEFLNSLSSSAPQIISLTEHHLRTEEINNVNFVPYTLAASFCRQTCSYRGVWVFFPMNNPLYTINIDQYNKEKNLEICALELNIIIK
jgi:hypothetical protein